MSCFIYAFTIVFSIPFQIHPIKNNIADAFSLGKKSKDLLGILVFSFSFICAIFDIVKFDTLTKLMSSSMNTLLCFGFPSFYLLTIKIKKSRQYYLMLLFTFLFTLMGLISFLKGLFTHIKKIFWSLFYFIYNYLLNLLAQTNRSEGYFYSFNIAIDFINKNSKFLFYSNLNK